MESLKNHIFIIIGKSNSGKTTVMNTIKTVLDKSGFNLHEIDIHTTRPRRVGEKDEYIFDTVDQYESYSLNNKICEERKYDVISDGKNAKWVYYTLGDDIECGKNYITINTPKGVVSIANYLEDTYGKDHGFCIHTLYIDCDDFTLIERATERERKQEVPNFKEMIRRMSADINDFSDSEIFKVSQKSNLVFFDYSKTLEPIAYRIMKYMFNAISHVDDSDPRKSIVLTTKVMEEYR